MLTNIKYIHFDTPNYLELHNNVAFRVILSFNELFEFL